LEGLEEGGVNEVEIDNVLFHTIFNHLTQIFGNLFLFQGFRVDDLFQRLALLTLPLAHTQKAEDLEETVFRAIEFLEEL
jgi:hypothetical protein